MDIIDCQMCSARLRPEDTDVIKLIAAAHYQESNHCCPYCGTVLVLEVTLATDDSQAAGPDSGSPLVMALSAS